MDKFIIRQPNKWSNNSKSSNIGSACTSTSHEEVAESFVLQQRNEKSSKDYEKNSILWLGQELENQLSMAGVQ